MTILIALLLTLFPLANTYASSLPSPYGSATTPTDAQRVNELLQRGQRFGSQDADELMVFYASELKDIPYVGQTLEVNTTEQLVVNLRELDCTTLVENAVALTLTTLQGSLRFEDYCQHLQRIRYHNGVMKGYASRNHYFSEWILSNEAMGLVKEIEGKKNDSRGAFFPFIEQQTLNCSYMSKHPDLYPMLRNNELAQKNIRQNEEQINGKTVHYIPRRLLNRGRKDLGCIHDGDILAIVTKKEGLDTSHLGIAVWGTDGKLHLLNASQIHKKVVLEPMTLYDYMKKHPSQLGVRVVRVGAKGKYKTANNNTE